MKTRKTTKEFCVLELFEKFISACRAGKRLQPNGKPISANTVINYRYTLALLQEFCHEKTFKLRVRPIRYLYNREMARERKYWKRFYTDFMEYLYKEKGHFDNYVGQTMKNLRVVFNYCNKELLMGLGDFHRQFYIRKEEVPIIALMPEELNYLIYDREFENRLSKRMNQVKDFFVFGCTVALRFSDLLKLKQSNLRRVNDSVYLLVRSQKTGTDTSIRLPDYAVSILEKYKLKNGFLLPRFNKSNLNIYVKKLCEAAGYTQPVVKARGLKGKPVMLAKKKNEGNDSYRFCDLVTTHTMRRTAITSMLCLGVPEPIVRKIRGHSPMSRDFFRYVSLAQSYQDQETMKMFEKLSEKRLVG